LCSCHGGAALYEGDSPDMSRRDSAIAAFNLAHETKERP
jgi:hypothetical protein